MWAVLLAVTQMDSFAMRAFDNGGVQASSDAMQFSRFSVCHLGLILFTVTNCI